MDDDEISTKVRGAADSGNLEEVFKVVYSLLESFPGGADRLYREVIGLALACRFKLDKGKSAVEMWEAVSRFLHANHRSYYDDLHALAIVTTAIEATTDSVVRARLLHLKSRIQQSMELVPQAFECAKASVDWWEAASDERPFSTREVDESLMARTWLKSLTPRPILD